MNDANKSYDFLPVLEENLAAMRSAKESNMRDVFDSDNIFDAVIETYEDLIAIYKHNQTESPSAPLADGWVRVEDRKPELIEGKDYSENVLAIVKDYPGIQVMCFGFQYGAEDESGWYWANCYGKIDGDAEWDDDYEVTHWQKLPQSPTKK